MGSGRSARTKSLGVNVKRILRRAMLAAAMLFVATAHAALSPHSNVSVEIDWHPTQGDSEGAVWLAYLMARASYIDRHEAAYDWKPGLVTPLFAEELAARTTVVQVYRELKDKQVGVAYFEDLAGVADNSFLGEYVWTYLHQAEWGSPPEKLRLVDFMHWRAEHLPHHVAMTKGSIRFAAKGKASPESTRQPASEMSVLSQGRKVLERHDSGLAIAGFFDPVIEHFERIYRDSGKRVYAARNQMQVLIYVALPNEEKKPVEVLDSTWSDAYLMKGYALVEMRRLGEAQATLESAVSLSPLTAQYISELAYTYQVQGQCERSIASYQQAESVVEMGSDDTTKTADLTRAWRGQGYCLVELGRLDEAEALYRKCLALDPSDTKAKGELQYIESKRAH
jgi:tetratricopeptide (TPR) repeat protein